MSTCEGIVNTSPPKKKNLLMPPGPLFKVCSLDIHYLGREIQYLGHVHFLGRDMQYLGRDLHYLRQDMQYLERDRHYLGREIHYLGRDSISGTREVVKASTEGKVTKDPFVCMFPGR